MTPIRPTQHFTGPKLYGTVHDAAWQGGIYKIGRLEDWLGEMHTLPSIVTTLSVLT